ncbi:cytochrome P450 [Nocardia sp. NPDC052112]|uniref:cytochrome P450 n=1 Tax=Nocardia sp. NPDC052112 TaxID=3155646 RepID=UPI003438493D
MAAVPNGIRADIGWRQAIADRNLPAALIGRAQRNGGIIRVRIPLPGRSWLISDFDLVDRVLRTGAGDFDKGGPIYRIIRKATGDEGLFAVNDPQNWRTLREHTNPAFAAANLAPLAQETVGRLVDRVGSWSPDRAVDVFTEFKLLNVELLARHLFGQAVDCATLIRLAQPIFDSQRKQWFRVGGGSYQRAIAAMDTEVYTIIDRRRAVGGSDGDLLAHLLQVRPELSVQRIRDQVMSHLMAGFDSTACAQAWACLRLADNPGELAGLRTELEQVVGNRTPEAADLARLPLLTALFGDVVTQRPSFPLIFRNVAVDTELAGRPLHSGDQLFIALGPARLPFGAGKRKCIGEPMALLTGALSIAVLAQRFSRWQRIQPGDQRVRYATTAPPRHSEILFTP